MHSGFPTLRNTFHTNFIARYEGLATVSAGARQEIQRVLRIWDEARRMTRERLGLGLGLGPGHGGKGKGAEDEDEDEGFLFGGFSIADAFYWPVLWICLRFLGWCLFLYWELLLH